MDSERGSKAEIVSIGGGEGEEGAIQNIDRGLKKVKKERGCTAKDRISKMPPCVAGKRSSIYRGVTRHRWTGRYEAHLWDKSTWNENQNKKGKQVYLGAYDEEEAAARAYDLAALKYWGPGTLINFPVSDYLRDLEEMQSISREDYLASLRRKSSGFSRGISKYRGLCRPTQGSPWETSLGRMGMPAYLSSMQYGTCEGTSTGSEYPGGFCIERKIDLSSYINWWGPNKMCQTDNLVNSVEETKCGGSEDICVELKALERGVEETEPYKMPCLSLSHGGKKCEGSKVSALNILLQSNAYKSVKEKVSKDEDTNEKHNENKRNSEMLGSGKLIEKSNGDGDTYGVALNMNWLPYERTPCPLTHFLSTSVLTSNCNTKDLSADTIFWRSPGSLPPTGPALITEVTKTETSSAYPLL